MKEKTFNRALAAAVTVSGLLVVIVVLSSSYPIRHEIGSTTMAILWVCTVVSLFIPGILIIRFKT